MAKRTTTATPTATPTACEYTSWRPFLDLHSPHAAYFASKDAYDAYDGVGLSREMGLLGMKRLAAANASVTRAVLPSGEIRVSECEANEADTRKWLHQRVGPLQTIGGCELASPESFAQACSLPIASDLAVPSRWPCR